MRLSVHTAFETRLVEQAVGAIQGMLRRAPGPNGEEGYTLFHHSLRRHILGAERVHVTVSRVRHGLAEAARHPTGDAAEDYLYRCGIRHQVADGNREGALDHLCDFAYAMARLKRLGGGLAAWDGLYKDWELVATAGLNDPGSAWWSFLRTNRHLAPRLP